MPQDKLEQLMLKRPMDVSGLPQLPQADPNSMDAKINRFLGNFFGVSDQMPGDTASALGAVGSMLPWGKVGKLLQFLPKGTKAGMPQLPKVNLPHEFHPMPNTGTMHGLPQIEIDKAVDLAKPRPHLERQVLNRAPVQPKNPLADGTLPKHKEVIPEFRSKSGMVVDVLDEMKANPAQLNRTPESITRVSQGKAPYYSMLDEFTDKYTGASPKLSRGHGSYVSDVGPDGTYPKITKDELVTAQLDKDPVGYVAQLRGLDEGAVSMMNPKVRAQTVKEVNEQFPNMDAESIVSKGPVDTDKLIQALADYFTSPKFDPFVRNGRLLEDIHDDLRARGLNPRAIPRAKERP